MLTLSDGSHSRSVIRVVGCVVAGVALVILVSVGGGKGSAGICDRDDGGRQSGRVALASQSLPRAFLALSRMTIMSPAKALRLAEKNKIYLRLDGSGLNTLNVVQMQYLNGDRSSPDPPELAPETVPVMQADGGAQFIEVVPLRLGRVEFTIYGKFPDGGYVNQRITVNVEPSETQPERLVVGFSFASVPRLVLSLSGEQAHRGLTIYAKYSTVKGTLRHLIKVDPDFAEFKIRTRATPVPILLDPHTGAISAVSPGDALIETHFQGEVNLTCVVVQSTESAEHGDFQERCQELLQPGEVLGEGK